MKNKNQKKLKNKKYRWGAYAPTQKIFTGGAPQNQYFTLFQCVNLR